MDKLVELKKEELLEINGGGHVWAKIKKIAGIVGLVVLVVVIGVDNLKQSDQ